MKPSDLLDYFDYSDFDSPDDKDSGFREMNPEFIRKLILARYIAGVPFKLNSGFRTEEHNRKVGGRPDSSHLRGVAIDTSATTSRVRFRILKGVIEAGFTRIGLDDSFIHVDDDKYKDQEVCWFY